MPKTLPKISGDVAPFSRLAAVAHTRGADILAASGYLSARLGELRGQHWAIHDLEEAMKVLQSALDDAKAAYAENLRASVSAEMPRYAE